MLTKKQNCPKYIYVCMLESLRRPPPTTETIWDEFQDHIYISLWLMVWDPPCPPSPKQLLLALLLPPGSRFTARRFDYFGPPCPPFVTLSHLFPRLTRIFTLSSTSSLPSTLQFFCFFCFLQDWRVSEYVPLQLHLLKYPENFLGALLHHLNTQKHTHPYSMLSLKCLLRLLLLFFWFFLYIIVNQIGEVKKGNVNKSMYTNKHLGPVSYALRLTAPSRHQPLYKADSSLTSAKWSEKNADWLLLDLRAHWLPAGCFLFFFFAWISQRCQLTPRWAAPVLLTVLQQQDKTASSCFFLFCFFTPTACKPLLENAFKKRSVTIEDIQMLRREVVIM